MTWDGVPPPMNIKLYLWPFERENLSVYIFRDTTVLLLLWLAVYSGPPSNGPGMGLSSLEVLGSSQDILVPWHVFNRGPQHNNFSGQQDPMHQLVLKCTPYEWLSLNIPRLVPSPTKAAPDIMYMFCKLTGFFFLSSPQWRCGGNCTSSSWQVKV